MFNKYNETKQRFTIKKYSFGAASVLIGIFFAGTAAQASETVKTETTAVSTVAIEKVLEAGAPTTTQATTTVAPSTTEKATTTQAPSTTEAATTTEAPKTETTTVAKKEEAKKEEATRTAATSYKVTYTDVETKQVVLSLSKSANGTTTKPVTEKAVIKEVVKAELSQPALADYRLADGQTESVLATLLEKNSKNNTVNFNVVKTLPVATRKEEDAVALRSAAETAPAVGTAPEVAESVVTKTDIPAGGATVTATAEILNDKTKQPTINLTLDVKIPENQYKEGDKLEIKFENLFRNLNLEVLDTLKSSDDQHVFAKLQSNTGTLVETQKVGTTSGSAAAVASDYATSMEEKLAADIPVAGANMVYTYVFTDNVTKLTDMSFKIQINNVKLDVPLVSVDSPLVGKISVNNTPVVEVPYTIGATNPASLGLKDEQLSIQHNGTIYIEKNPQGEDNVEDDSIRFIESTVGIVTGKHTLPAGSTFKFTLNDPNFSKFIPSGPTTPFQIKPTSSPYVANKNNVLIPTIGGKLTTLQIIDVKDNEITMKVVEGELVPKAGYVFYLNGNNPSKGAYRVFSKDTYNLVKQAVNIDKLTSIKSAVGGTIEVNGAKTSDGSEVSIKETGNTVAWNIKYDQNADMLGDSTGFPKILDAEVTMRFVDVLTGKEITEKGVTVIDQETSAFNDVKMKDRYVATEPTVNLKDVLVKGTTSLTPTEKETVGVNGAGNNLYETKAPYIVEGKDGNLYQFVGYGDETKYPGSSTSGLIPFEENQANIVAEYIKLAYGTVNIKFIDTNGNEIDKMKPTQYDGTRNADLTNAVGQPYDVTTAVVAPKTINKNGFTYRLVEEPKNLKGNLSADTIEVFYRYDVEQIAEFKFEVAGKDGAAATPLADATVTEKGLKTQDIPANAYEAKKAELEAKGYEVVTDAFKDAAPDAKKFDADAAKNQEFKVVLREKIVDITDPNDPRLPQVIKDELAKPENALKEVVNQTITYVKADGSEAATTKKDKVEFTRTLKVNLVKANAGDLTAIEFGEWTPVNADEKFDAKPTPVVTGFLATTVETEGKTAKATAEIAEVTKVNPTDTDAKHTHKVVYAPISNYTLEKPDGTVTVPYKNHDTDPTAINPNQDPIPYVEGYTPKDENGQPLTPVDEKNPAKGYIAPTPKDSGQPTPIKYEADAQTANIVFKKEGATDALATVTENGKSTEAISPAQYVAKLKELVAQGYEVVTDGFGTSTGITVVETTDKKFDTQADAPAPAAPTQVFEVVVKERVIDVTDPNDPRLPQDLKDKIAKDGGLKEEVNQTVTYVKADGSEAAKTVTDKVEFTRTVTVNLVTKDVKYGEWTPVNADKKFDVKPSPVVEGFLADKKEVAEVTEVGATDTDEQHTHKVTYSPIGKFVVTKPDGSTEEFPYKNDQQDPTKVSTTDKPTIPYVEGYTPTHNGTPLKPVDENDPKKGYIAPDAPANGTPDTPIKYEGTGQTATITFKNEAGAVLATVTENGKAGEPISVDAYNAKLTEYLNAGYEVVAGKDTFAALADKKFDTQADTPGAAPTQAFEVVLRERVIPLTPDAKPGEPIDKNNPNGPKWPDTIKNVLDKEEVLRTITYVNDKGETVSAQVVQKLGFHRSAVVNLVNLVTTVITQGEWTADDKNSFDLVKSPVVKGYLADRAEVPATGVIKGDAADITEKVTYKPIGGYVVTTPDGKETTIPYTNDETDPTKVDENDKPTIPYVEGYVPQDGNGNPLKPVDEKDPTKGYIAPDAPENGTPDTPIKYVPTTATEKTPEVTPVEKTEDIDKITEEDITNAVTIPGLDKTTPGLVIKVKDGETIPTTDEPGDKGTVTVEITYPDGSKEEVEVPVNVKPNLATEKTPTVTPVEKTEDIDKITEEDITNAVTIPGLDKTTPGLVIKVKDGETIPTTDEPGDKGTVTVEITYPDGSKEEVEVPVKVTPNDATNTTPVVTKVEKTEDVEKITEEDIKNAITLPGVDRDKTTLTILDPLPTTDEPGDKGTVTVEITYPDGSKETVEVPVNVKPNLATTKDPFAIPVEKVEDTPLTEEDITNNIKGVPTGSTFEIKDPLPTTDEPGDKGTVTVEITYPDGSKEEIEVPVKVTPNDATKNTPTPKPVVVEEGTPITKDDITGGITGTPTGTTYEIVDPIPTTETPGDKGTVTVVVTYPDGSKEEVEVPVKVTPKPVTPKPTDAETHNPVPNTVEKVEDTPLTEKDITDAVPGLPAGTKVVVKDPTKIPTTENPGDKGTVTVVVTYPDGSTEEVEVPVKVTPNQATTTTPVVKEVVKVEDTPLTEEDITGAVSGLPNGTKVTVKDPSEIPTTETPGDKGTVTVVITYPDGSTEEVEVPVRVTPNQATTTTPVVTPVEKVQGTPLTEGDITGAISGVPTGTTFEVVSPIPGTETSGFKGTVTVLVKYPDGSTELVEVPVNVTPLPNKGTVNTPTPTKPTIIYVDQDGNVLTPDANGNVPGYELVEIKKDANGNTVYVYRKVVKAPAKPTKPAAKPAKKATAGVLPKTSAANETNSALPAGLAAALAAAGLLAARRRKEDK